MKKFDRISIAGLLLGIGVILTGQVLEGGSVASLAQPTALLIVLGGTLGAVMLQSPLPVFMAGMNMFQWVFMPPVIESEEMLDRMILWSHIARREGLLALEAQLSTLKEPYYRDGLQLLVDGAEPGGLREVLEVQIDTYEAQMKSAARIWEAAAGYSPTIGILGAVMGLIHVMENLTDPAKLGAGIAVAFVATIYGVGLANLVYLPVARKLYANIAQLVTLREMYLDGLIGITNGDNPHLIENRMRGHFE